MSDGAVNIVLSAGFAFLIAWCTGTLLDAVRNRFTESILDKFFPPEVNWDFFFFKDSPEKVAQLEEHYYAYYTLDMNFSIGIFLFLVAEFMDKSIIQIDRLPDVMLFLLFVAMVIFFADAMNLSKEIKELIKTDEETAAHEFVCPTRGVQNPRYWRFRGA